MTDFSMNNLRVLAGMEPLEESVDVPGNIDEEAQALSESTISINQKIKAAEWAFLGNAMFVSRQHMKKQYRGLNVEVERFPATGGRGSIGSIRLSGDGWQVDAVISRKGDGWEFRKSGTMSVGAGAPVMVKDMVKMKDIHPESIANGLNVLYGDLVEKNEGAKQ